jgi:hypothetical protein
MADRQGTRKSPEGSRVLIFRKKALHPGLTVFTECLRTSITTGRQATNAGDQPGEKKKARQYSSGMWVKVCRRRSTFIHEEGHTIYRIYVHTMSNTA